MKHVYIWTFFRGRLLIGIYPYRGDWKWGVKRFNSWFENGVFDIDLGPLKVMV